MASVAASDRKFSDVGIGLGVDRICQTEVGIGFANFSDFWVKSVPALMPDFAFAVDDFKCITVIEIFNDEVTIGVGKI